MKRWMRAWGSTVLAWAIVIVIGGAAIAGGGSSAPPEDKGSPRALEAVGTEVEAPDTETTDAEDTSEVTSHEAADNHGQCVSTWAHQAKDEGLEGSAFGAFVSSVAQSDETGEDCDFAAQLEAALAEQEETQAVEEQDESESSSQDNSAKTHGKSADHRPAR